MKLENEKIGIILMLLFLCLGLWIALLLEPISTGQPYNDTALVNTTVNITNSAPLVQTVTLPNPITLTAYGNTTVICNVTVFDYDNDTVIVNATFHQNNTLVEDPNDQNNHYTNTSCSMINKINERS